MQSIFLQPQIFSKEIHGSENTLYSLQPLNNNFITSEPYLILHLQILYDIIYFLNNLNR